MKLIIGGYAQGKLRYALKTYGLAGSPVWDGTLPDRAQEGAVIVNHFHRWVKACLIQGGRPEEEAAAFLERCPDCIVISDEIGNGIVPTDDSEREYRERMGRLLTQLAGQAQEVVRVICGLGQRIK